jgi:hypothetical protein
MTDGAPFGTVPGDHSPRSALEALHLPLGDLWLAAGRDDSSRGEASPANLCCPQVSRT